MKDFFRTLEESRKDISRLDLSIDWVLDDDPMAGLKQDAEALRGDWEAVGSYIRQGMNQIDEKIKSEKTALKKTALKKTALKKVA